MELYVIQGILFKYLGRDICRDYYLCRLNERHVLNRGKYTEDEMILQESDLHI
jgi:hypothetical protein